MHSLASEGPGNEGSAHGCLQVKWRAFGPLESRGAKTFESHGPKVKAQCVTAQPCEKTAHQNELLFLCESQEGVHQCWREPPTK